MRALFFVGLLLSAPAFAIKVGDSMYVSLKEATVRAQPKDKGAKVVTVRAGDRVRWLGVSDKDRRFQSVETAEGKRGFLLTSELTPNQPQLEVDLTGKLVAPGVPLQGVTKCDMGSVRAAPASAQDAEQQAQLAEAEAINRAAATPEALAKKQQELSR